VGQRLIPALLKQGHELICCVRNKSRFERDHHHERIQVLEFDFVNATNFPVLPQIDIAYYLIHSMSSAVGSFEGHEARAAKNFLMLIEKTSCGQVIYLSGIVNEDKLSHHLSSRLAVEQILRNGPVPVTVLRAGIVVGSGSASFEIIRDLVEKLPVMVAPKWLNTKCQPIAVRNVIQFLVGVMQRESTFNKDFDIGGPEVLTYEQMLRQFAEVRNLKRYILTVPVMSPRLSSYWLFFITSTSYTLAVNLVDSMKVNIVGRENSLTQDLGIKLLTYREAVRTALERIENQNVLSSWRDSFSSSGAQGDMMNYVKVPEHGCFIDLKTRAFKGNIDNVWSRVWNIGGNNGWYYADFLWEVRGLLDKAAGGVGLNRGKTQAAHIHAGDALDFWRVLVADENAKRLLLFAEMKLPGEAWLEFRIETRDGTSRLIQTATFRPRGLLGRLYWYSLLPFHHFIFNGMIDRLVNATAH
jgi:uncharacterized protein YbjT (DUF2867 family)